MNAFEQDGRLVYDIIELEEPVYGDYEVIPDIFTRVRPARHAFAFRSFYLRLPLRTLAAQPWPFRRLPRNRFGWLSFHDADHGDGGDPVAWIDGLLQKEGITDAVGEIWLHTLPRVFGYVFNPVSFWFCHRNDGALRAVLCEVNNTFGERHC